MSSGVIHPRMRLANELILKCGNYKFTDSTLRNNLVVVYSS